MDLVENSKTGKRRRRRRRRRRRKRRFVVHENTLVSLSSLYFKFK
jgi:hypothetical protein